jgi:hypothetical protein
MDWTLEVVILPVNDHDGNTWSVQQLKVRAEKPLIPPEHRARFAG